MPRSRLGLIEDMVNWPEPSVQVAFRENLLELLPGEQSMLNALTLHNLTESDPT